MWYSIVGKDAPGTLKLRLQTRADHLTRLQALQNEGRLLVAGPNPAIDSAQPGDAGFVGSLIIAEFPDLASAQAWADNDPYVHAGVYESVTVNPFIKVLP
ncbi:YciI family protein [Halioxenophilus aromaticivorans]|uniref:YciI family protein n=1 Tax=Halioxenophilus aromaticivorans TaxID=1306992 RepID=A0AAV3TVY7_9ALTE